MGIREMIFRGKRKDNGKWVYGWYCRYPFGEWPLKDAIIPSEEAESGHYRFVEVDPSTVGQYTGLTDKNGQKIFEGDIFLPPGEEDAHIRLVVEFKDYTWKLRWLGRESSFNHYLSNWDGEIYKVIGNIHDNPELLGEVSGNG